VRSRDRAALFDLDETLYPERRFALSGFSAVARATAPDAGIPARDIFRLLYRALKSGRRADALQTLCSEMGWPESRIPGLIAIIRGHRPNLRLPVESVLALESMRPIWSLAIVTNGPPSLQAGKIAALGVGAQVDAVVYAAEHGSGAGKPEPESFAVAAARLGVPAERCVFVGDHPRCDVWGARQLGMKTIRIRRGVFANTIIDPADEADAVTTRVAEVPRLARMLLGEAESVCA
jgi:putative hydrolase of the HAD superfamily